jgi:hypothetical protein
LLGRADLRGPLQVGKLEPLRRCWADVYIVDEGKQPLRPLNLKNVSVNLLRYASVRSSFIAASATCALIVGVWFRRFLVAML